LHGVRALCLTNRQRAGPPQHTQVHRRLRLAQGRTLHRHRCDQPASTHVCA
jgi:hypothetical protein